MAAIPKNIKELQERCRKEGVPEGDLEKFEEEIEEEDYDLEAIIEDVRHGIQESMLVESFKEKYEMKEDLYFLLKAILEGTPTPKANQDEPDADKKDDEVMGNGGILESSNFDSVDAQSNESQSKAPVYPVQIHVYDLSQGMAAMFSQQFIGQQVDGIWHTSIIVYEKEYFYGGELYGAGILSGDPGTTSCGIPSRTVDMGFTNIPQSAFHEYLHDIAPRFSLDKYDLFKHNGNTFTNEVMNFLNGKSIPQC